MAIAQKVEHEEVASYRSVRKNLYASAALVSFNRFNVGFVKGTASGPALNQINLECAIKATASKYEKSENLNVCFEGGGTSAPAVRSRKRP